MWKFAIKRIPVENLHGNDFLSMKSTCSEFEASLPPQVYIENAKSSLSAEGQHHYKIFSESACKDNLTENFRKTMLKNLPLKNFCSLCMLRILASYAAKICKILLHSSRFSLLDDQNFIRVQFLNI